MSAKLKKDKPVEKKKLPKKERRIPYPWIWISVIILLVYAPSFDLGYTELDDTIFINEHMEYNKDMSNLAHSFQRGVFAEKKDTYYRPLLLDSFIINYQFSKDSVKGYHAMNIFLHLISVVLLFYVLTQMKIPEWNAFLLSVLFAVHPVFTQAVSWIPGRNDTLLAVFAFAFMLTSLRFIASGKFPSLLLSGLFLLAALFTKETALVIAFAFFVLIVSLSFIQWKDKAHIKLYAVWAAGILIWFLVRAAARLEGESLTAALSVSNAFGRLPVIIQYFGKGILPVNMSVFPMMEDTSYIFGIISIVIIAALLFTGKEKNKRMIIGGSAWFLLLMMPVVLLPGSLNEQDFEHRLYVPFFGILLVLSQTALFKNLKPVTTAAVVGVIAIIFTVMNIRHQQTFSDPLTFWESAVHTTPHSSYATMMLAARLDKTDKKRADEMMLHAYDLNPKEKYINYYVGKLYLDRGEVAKAEKYLLEELNISSYYETWFELSRVEFEKKNMEQSIIYMEKYLSFDPRESQAINNYILMLISTGQKPKAQEFIRQKQKVGIIIPQELIDQAGQ